MLPIPYPDNESQRVAALHKLQILDSGPDQSYDDLVFLASMICNTPMAMVSLVDRDRQWFKSKIGISATETPRDISFCTHTIMRPSDLLIVDDATKDPRFTDSPLVTGDPEVRFYAGAPLVTHQGLALGAICVVDKQPRTLDARQAEALRCLARQVVALFELRQALLKSSSLIAQLDQAREELASAIRMTEAAGRAKNELIGNMSHELRTPLTAILGYADLLLDSSEGRENQVPYVRIIQRNGEHLLNLMDDLVDLSHIEADLIDVKRSACAPLKILEDVCSAMQARASLKRLTIRTECVYPIPRAIETDPKRVRQILINLVANAIKFSNQGEVTLRVRLDSKDAPKSIIFDVEDRGVGFDPEQISRLMSQVVQQDDSAGLRLGGAGLGLTISQRLASLLHGSLSVETAPGEGSTFHLQIPIGGPVEFVQGLAREGDLRPIASSTHRHFDRPYRILVAEDGADSRLLISRFLLNAGASVQLVENGRQAIDAALRADASGRPFDVILMDMQMPVLDGFDATIQLRRAGYRPPIIALTARTMTSERDRCFQAGCNNYAVKPLDRDSLIALVERYATADTSTAVSPSASS